MSGGSANDRPAKIGRRAFVGGAGALLATAGLGAREALHPRAPASWTSTIGERRRVQPRSLFRARTAAPVVALTFDDGPDPDHTPRVLDLLAAHDFHATFFVVGVNATAYPELIARQLAAGHVLGNHTYDHAELSSMSAEQVRVEIERGADAIAAAGAPRPALFRPPRGHTDSAIATIADSHGYRTVFWEHCLERLIHQHGVERGADALVQRVRHGDVVLIHDGCHVHAADRPVLDRRPTMAALPRVLDGLAARGVRSVAVPTLLSLGSPQA